MSIASVIGLDHAVVVVRDLDAAERMWRQLGFTISPRGLHSAHMGTANHTIMLQDDYLELMGVVAATERNAPMREMLKRTEGIDRVAFTTTDAAQGFAALQARGLAESVGPIGFSRPVTLADGRVTDARFETFQWPLSERPGGLRIFACQHFTRDAVWLPELTTHANGATAIRHVEIMSDDPKAAAEHMSRLIDQPVVAEAGGVFAVPSGAGRGAFHFLDKAAFAARHPGVPLESLPDWGGVALSLATDDVQKARAVLGGMGLATAANVVTVAPKTANGVLIDFVGA